MSKFDYISDPRLRQSLEDDTRDLAECMKVGAWKSVHVLAGSIIEAVLVDYVSGLKQAPPELLNMTLGQLIEHCRKNNILSVKAVSLSVAVKDFRNLIHPGKVQRTQEKADADTATVAQSLVNIIVAEIAEQKKETYGFTAEQIVNKIIADSSCIGVLAHLIPEVPPFELERLIIEVLPKRAFERYIETQAAGDLEVAYRHIFKSVIQEDIKRKALTEYVRIIKNEGSLMVYYHEAHLFRCDEIEFIPKSSDRRLVIEHFLNRLGAETEPKKLKKALFGIGPFLEPRDIETCFEALLALSVDQPSNRLNVFAREFGKASEDAKAMASHFLLAEIEATSNEFRRQSLRKLGTTAKLKMT